MTANAPISAVLLADDVPDLQSTGGGVDQGGDSQPIAFATAGLGSLETGETATRLQLREADVVVLWKVQGERLHAAKEVVRALTAAPILLVAAGPLSMAQFEEAAHLGIFDVVDGGADRSTLRFAVERAAVLGAPTVPAAGSPRAEHDDAGNQPRLVSVMSVRGGAGATTVAVNLATAKARLWAREVLLLDFDLEGADVALACGVDVEQTVMDVMHAHGDIDWLKLRSFLVHTSAGFALLPGARWPEDARTARPELLLDIVSAARGHADMVVVDLPQSFSAPTVAALERSDELLVVLTPEVTAVRHALHTFERLQAIEFPTERVRLVLNQDGAPGALDAHAIERTLGRRIDARIAHDPALRRSLNIGIPLVQSSLDAPAVRGIVELCELLGERHDPGVLARARRHLLRRRRSRTPIGAAG